MTKIPYAGTTVNRHLTQQERDNLRYVTARSEPHRIAKGLRKPTHFPTVIGIDYGAIEARIVAYNLYDGKPNVNYCYYMSASSLAAVYKARVACGARLHDDISRQVDAFNYAVRRGVVFG